MDFGLRAVALVGDDVGDAYLKRLNLRPVAGDAALGGDPDVSMAVFQKSLYGVVGESVLFGERLEDVAIKTADAAAEGAKP